MKMINLHQVAEEGVSHNAKIRKRQILGNGIVEPITHYARAVFPPGEKASAHRHDDMSEVFTVESGCGEIRINEVAFVFSEGLTVVVEPGEVHEIVNTGNAELIVTYFGVLAG